MPDGKYSHYWVGYVGQGVEDAALMNDQFATELEALIESNKVSIAHKRYVVAVGHQMFFWELNLAAATPITEEIKATLESYVKDVSIGLDNPLDDQDD